MTTKTFEWIIVFGLFLAFGCKSDLTCQLKHNEIYNHLAISELSDLIEIYKEDYGGYPEKLSQLVQIYRDGADYFGLREEIILNYVKDPFNEGQDLKYYVLSRNEEPFYVLYSIGPDQVDDHKVQIQKFIKGDTDTLLFKSVYFDAYNLPENAYEEKGDILLNKLTELPHELKVEKILISTTLN